MELKIARKIAGLTQQQLAKQAGVTNSFISLIEAGKRDLAEVNYSTVVRLAEALHLAPDELLRLTQRAAPDQAAQ